MSEDEQVTYEQADRVTLRTNPAARTYVKRARIIAIQQVHPFKVHTDRGIMTGEPGDWLVTNHPDDDPDSDVWSISDERMQGTYVLATDDVPRTVPLQDPPEVAQ
jgi:hypothetical protein